MTDPDPEAIFTLLPFLADVTDKKRAHEILRRLRRIGWRSPDDEVSHNETETVMVDIYGGPYGGVRENADEHIDKRVALMKAMQRARKQCWKFDGESRSFL